MDTTTLDNILPLFGLVFCGYLVGRIGILDESGIKGLTGFVFYVAIPALLFRTLVRGAAPALEDLAIVVVYYSGCFALFFVAILLARVLFRLPADQLAVFGMGSTYGNTVMLGLPLVSAIYGEPALLPTLLIITFHNALLIPATVLIVEISRNRKGKWHETLQAVFQALIANPVVIALAIGLAWLFLELPLPTPLERLTGLLAQAATPTALFAVGATMISYRIAGDISQSLLIAALKLLALPAAVWLIATQLWGLDPLRASVATLIAAMPTGANVFVLARSYEIYVARAGSALLISTGIAIVTVGLLLRLLT